MVSFRARYSPACFHRQEYFAAFRLEYSTVFTLEYSTAFRLEYCPAFLHSGCTHLLSCIQDSTVLFCIQVSRIPFCIQARVYHALLHSGKRNFCFPAFKQEMSSACLNSGENTLLHAAFRKA
jgi:hypothetical protein